MDVEVGKTAPDFELPDQDGKPVKLSELKGSPVVLYFYPKDDTPGCTKQACGLRDSWSEIEQLGATVLGVSPDKPDKHVKFRQKYDLPFTLLADSEHKAADSYKVWKKKALYGRSFLGIERSTFIIDEEGKIVNVMRKVKPESHAEDVLAELKLLQNGQ